MTHTHEAHAGTGTQTHYTAMQTNYIFGLFELKKFLAIFVVGVIAWWAI